MRDEIVKYLGTVAHSSAKALSERMGLDRLEVAKELNAMHTETIIEREKRGGGGNEYVYWLTRSDDVNRLEAALDTLPSVKNDPPPMPPVALAKPEEPKISAAEKDRTRLEAEIFDLRASKENMREKIKTLTAQVASLEKSIKETASTPGDYDAMRADRDYLVEELSRVSAANAKLIAEVKTLREQIEQYEERKRFDAMFGTRPESVKEAMWESWLERSKLIELEKETA